MIASLDEYKRVLVDADVPTSRAMVTLGTGQECRSKPIVLGN